MMEDSERVEISVAKRKELEWNVREAEILLGLVRKHLQNADDILGVGTTRYSKRMTPAEADAIIQAYKGGASARQIAHKRDWSIASITKVLKKAGLFQSRPREAGRIG